MEIWYNLKMIARYGKPFSHVHRMRYLARFNEPQNGWYLAPNGFHHVEHEYEFMFQTMAPRAFATPDGQMRTLRAVNIYWETLTQLENEFDVNSRDLAAEAFTIAKAIEGHDQDFETNFYQTLIILILDKDEEHGWSKGKVNQ